MKQRAPARAAASAASAVGASVKCGCTPLRANAASARQAARSWRHNSFRPPNKRMLGLISSSRPSGGFDGHLRRERGGDAGQPLHERQFARRVTRPGVDMRRGRKRRAQRHAEPDSRRLRPGIRVDDARIARLIEHHERRGRTTRQCNESSDNCGTCAAIHNSRGSSASAAWPEEPGPVGGGGAGRTRKTDGAALTSPGSKSVFDARGSLRPTHAAAAAHVRSMGSRLPPRLLSRLSRAPCLPAATMGSSNTRNMAGEASLANFWLR